MIDEVAASKAELDEQTKIKMKVDVVLAAVANFQDDLEESVLDQRLGIKGKILSVAIAEHPGWLVYYDQRRAELRYFLRQIEAEVERIHGTFHRYYCEKNAKDIGERSVNQYCRSQSNYNKAINIKIEIEAIYDRYTAVCEAFISRGFQLRDMTNARVAEVHTAVL